MRNKHYNKPANRSKGWSKKEYQRKYHLKNGVMNVINLAGEKADIDIIVLCVK